jgi:hypothetical protein
MQMGEDIILRDRFSHKSSIVIVLWAKGPTLARRWLALGEETNPRRATRRMTMGEFNLILP